MESGVRSMLQDALKTVKKVIGVKQTMKAIEKDRAKLVYVAGDADSRIIEPLKELCTSKKIEMQIVDSMAVLGQACGIEVGAAAVGVVD